MLKSHPRIASRGQNAGVRRALALGGARPSRESYSAGWRAQKPRARPNTLVAVHPSRWLRPLWGELLVVTKLMPARPRGFRVRLRALDLGAHMPPGRGAFNPPANSIACCRSRTGR